MIPDEIQETLSEFIKKNWIIIILVGICTAVSLISLLRLPPDIFREKEKWKIIEKENDSGLNFTA